MTTVVWNSYEGVLAADKRVNACGLHRTVTKIFRIGSMLVGAAGNGWRCSEMIEWARTGFDADLFPEFQRDEDTAVDLLVILPTGKILSYGVTPCPVEYEDKQFAIGSGRDFALAAMRLGKTAREAVLFAAEFDPGTGNGVDTLTL